MLTDIIQATYDKIVVKNLRALAKKAKRSFSVFIPSVNFIFKSVWETGSWEEKFL